MSLPELTCPNCGTSMPLEVALGHQGARDAMAALATLHPSATRLQMLALRYVGLFAPVRQKMRLDRVAAVLSEVSALLAPGTVEWEGINYAAPLPYWMDAMEAILSRQGELELPFKNHNYLRKVVSGNLKKEANAAERKKEDALTGRTQTGGLPPPPPLAAPQPKAEAPKFTRPPISAMRDAIGLGQFIPKHLEKDHD